MPDATGLELIAQELRDTLPGAVLDTLHFRGEATITVERRQAHDVLAQLKRRGYSFLASLHGVDYYPEEPRLSVHYQLLDMDAVDRICVKVRMGLEEAQIASVFDLWPGANHPEREVYDMFGIVFDDHPDLRRILMPEDYEGYPQRRDFPVGGEPVIFTYNEDKIPGWTE